MRRKLLGSVAIWLAGGVALAGDEPHVSMLGVIPDPPPAPGLASFLDTKSPAGPAVLPLQQLATPTGVTIKQAAYAAPDAPISLPTTAPAPVAAEPVVVTEAGLAASNAGGDRFFGSADYVLGWMRHNPTPPLVQVIPANLANFKAGGALPPGAATTVFGDQGTDPGTFSGVRVFLGAYFDDAKCWGVDGSYLQLFQKSDGFGIASSGVPVIGRAFHDSGDNTDSFLRYSTPDGLTTGFIRVDAPAQMYTFDANLRTEGPSFLSDRVDLLFGLRYLNLKDSTTIDSGATINSTTGAPPFMINSHESFAARNEFYGSQFGFETHYRWGCYSLEVTAKCAFGWVNQDVRIEGVATSQSGTAAPIVFPNQSILLVQPTNAGDHSRNHIAVLPEGLVKVGYQITPNIKATIGYDLLVLTSAERSGVAIDTNVNPSLTKFVQVVQPSTALQPSFGFHPDDWWAQGLTLGLAFTY
jgi:hypothetical protein